MGGAQGGGVLRPGSSNVAFLFLGSCSQQLSRPPLHAREGGREEGVSEQPEIGRQDWLRCWLRSAALPRLPPGLQQLPGAPPRRGVLHSSTPHLLPAPPALRPAGVRARSRAEDRGAPGASGNPLGAPRRRSPSPGARLSQASSPFPSPLREATVPRARIGAGQACLHRPARLVPPPFPGETLP